MSGAGGDGSARGASTRLLPVLVLATALGPLAMQIFVPALPAIQGGFGVSAATAQLTLSLSALSIAVATLAYGPLSDRFGRRPALLGGLAVYLAGSLACGLATSMSALVLGRIVQAAGGCAGIVLSRAIVRDLYDRDRSATLLAYITSAMVVAPMLAPALGGVLTDLAGWRSVFAFGGLLGLAIAAVVAAELPETAPQAVPAAGGRSGFLRLMQRPAFWAYSLQVSFSLGVFYAFLAAAPFLMVGVLGRPASEYGLLFMMVPGAFMLGNLAAARLSPRVGIDRMILIGSVGCLAGALALLALTALGPWAPLAIFAPTSVCAFSQGLSMPNAQAAVVSVDPRAAGAASSLSGFLQMALAAAAAQVVGSIETGTPYPMAVGMTLCAAAALACALPTGLRRWRRRRRRRSASGPHATG